MSAWNIIIPTIAVGGTSAWAAFHPRSRLFGPIVRSAGDGCALTFDDGPDPRVTPRLLALLDKYQVPATFFVLGKYAAEHSGLTKEIAARKHVIGNHTYGHRSLVFLSRQHIIDELQRCDEAVFRATGNRTVCVRPPFGFRGPQFFTAARTAGYSQIVMWSLNGRDWKPQPAEAMRNRLKKVGPGDIVLLHDGDHQASNVGREHMLDALEFWIPRWKDAGIRFTSQIPYTQHAKMT